MQIRLKVSYEDDAALRWLLELLGDHVVSWKRSGNREGRYRKAYITITVK